MSEVQSVDDIVKTVDGGVGAETPVVKPKAKAKPKAPAKKAAKKPGKKVAPKKSVAANSKSLALSKKTVKA